MRLQYELVMSYYWSWMCADGVDNYLDMAIEMNHRLGSEWVVVGAQDMAALGRQASAWSN
eukprot:SAG31_NODE_1208_length_9381_cov_49.003232_9_plen_60_part_00